MNAPTSAAIILARLDSARLPAKALKNLCGKPLIARVLERLRAVCGLETVVLATTARQVDDALADYFTSMGGAVYRGPPEENDNVAMRFVSAARVVGATYAYRVNGDSPFPSAELFSEAHQYWMILLKFVKKL